MKVCLAFRAWRTILAGNADGLGTTAYKKTAAGFTPAAAIESADLFKAGDGRRFRGKNLEYCEQLGDLQDFLKFRAEVA